MRCRSAETSANRRDRGGRRPRPSVEKTAAGNQSHGPGGVVGLVAQKLDLAEYAYPRSSVISRAGFRPLPERVCGSSRRIRVGARPGGRPGHWRDVFAPAAGSGRGRGPSGEARLARLVYPGGPIGGVAPFFTEHHWLPTRRLPSEEASSTRRCSSRPSLLVAPGATVGPGRRDRSSAS